MVWYDRLSVFPAWLGKTVQKRNEEIQNNCLWFRLSENCPVLPVLFCPLLPSLCRLLPWPPSPPCLKPIPCHPTWPPMPLLQTFSILFTLPQNPAISSTLLINCLPPLPPATFLVLPYSHKDSFVPCGLGFLFSEVHGRCLRDHREQPVTQHPESSVLSSPDGP